AFHVVDRGQTIDEEQIRQLIIELMPPQQPVIPFVTITPITIRENILEGYELWFHLDGVVERNEGKIGDLNPENLAMFVEPADGVIDQVPYEITPIRSNLWMVFPQTDNDLTHVLVRFTFSLERPMPIVAYNPRSGDMDGFDTLGDYINKTGQQLEGHRILSDKMGESLVVYVREQSSARRIEQ
ncbi:MAG: hypothetical protein WAM60_05155, partial [Candidatus Promineifilaceae bacterium]